MKAKISINIILILILLFSTISFISAITYNGKNVEVLLPVYGTYKCEAYGSKAYPSYTLPASGFWIDRSIAYTDAIEGIKVYVSKSFWDNFVDILPGTSTRIFYKICDGNRNYCEEGSKNVNGWGDVYLDNLPIGISTKEKSIFIQLQRRLLWGNWEGKDPKDSRIYFGFQPYALKIYDENIGFGEPVCETSCSLSCPGADERGEGFIKICPVGVQSGECSEKKSDVVDFNTGTSYLKYFKKEPIYTGDQNGGTIWVEKDEKFCFGGYLYNPSELTTESGETYIFPGAYTGQKKSCCPGAVIVLADNLRKCNDNYEWEITTQFSCPLGSDMECPGKGKAICQKKDGKYMENSWTCKNKVCVESKDNLVDCCTVREGCLEDEICQNGECVGGGVVPPIENCLTDEDCITKANGKCISGRCKYPSEDICSSCDAFVKSNILGMIKSFKCVPRWNHTNFLCWASYLKLGLVPIAFIIVWLFGIDFLKIFPVLKDKKKQGIRIGISALIGLIAGFLVFYLFWIGLIALIIFIAIRVALKFLI
jgi:hypothetical protein